MDEVLDHEPAAPGGQDLASLSSLDDPLRRRLYEVVTSRTGPVSRDEAAQAAGIGRALAVYHLDKLVESGLLDPRLTRGRPGGAGPGPAVPAKVYARSDREFAVTVPPREYELAARLLVQAVEGRSERPQPGRAGRGGDRRLGTELGSAARLSPGGQDAGGQDAGGQDAGGRNAAGQGVTSVLTQQGYEPCGGANGVIRLRNCPFHQLTERHREVVCGMNLALVEGLVEGLGAEGWRPALDPRPGYCCVAIGGGAVMTDGTIAAHRTGEYPGSCRRRRTGGGRLPGRAGDRRGPGGPAGHPGPDGPRLRRAVRRAAARLTTFPNDEGYDELVLARAIPFRTVCEHHLLPFSGVAHVGYLPGERIVGLSKLARLVDHFAARPQVQERLTKQVAECLATRLRAPGVGVVLEAEHSCMTLRGVRALGSKR